MMWEQIEAELSNCTRKICYFEKRKDLLNVDFNESESLANLENIRIYYILTSSDQNPF